MKERGRLLTIIDTERVSSRQTEEGEIRRLSMIACLVSGLAIWSFAF